MEVYYTYQEELYSVEDERLQKDGQETAQQSKLCWLVVEPSCGFYCHCNFIVWKLSEGNGMYEVHIQIYTNWPGFFQLQSPNMLFTREYEKLIGADFHI